MTIQEAIKTLDQVCAGFHGTRADHVTMQQAMQTVTEALQTATEAPEPKPNKKESDGNK